MKVVLVIMIYSIIALFEGKRLLKNSEIKELIIYGLMMLFSLILSLLLIVGIKIPSPADFIEKIVVFFIK
jgi:hypothetical protein